MSEPLAAEVLGHLDRQIESARRLLDVVLRQGSAIRAREVDTVLACVEEIGGEMALRSDLEGERGRVLAGAARELAVSPAEVSLEALAGLLEPTAAMAARARSAELRGLLAELAREHGINRALMRQEMQFLDHLTRLAGGEPEPGYHRGPDGAPRAARPVPAGANRLRLLDASA